LDRGVEQGQKEEERWMEIQDLWVERVERELLATKEAYIMVWERRRVKKRV